MDLDIKATDSLLRSPSDEEFEKVLRPRRRLLLLPLFSSLLGILPAIVVYLVMARLARETGSVERLYKTPIPECMSCFSILFPKPST
jgi:Na+-transporting methylmalonyl-CoA/oxaloacetate decarboxylase beta subunit